MSVRLYQSISRFWFILSVSSLGLACCLAIILIVSRMPVVDAWFDTATFQSALVLHVNFSLFIWLFSFAASLWTFYFARKNKSLHLFIAVLSLIAISGMLAAAILHEPRPVLSNYLPVLDNSLYLTSVLIFCSGYVILLLDLSFTRSSTMTETAFFCPDCLQRLLQIMLLCLLLLPWTAMNIPVQGHAFYELLFWGIGHQVQYLFTLLMLWGWIWLATRHGHSLTLSARQLKVAFYLALLPLLASLFLPLFYSPEDPQYRLWFTRLMYSSPLLLPVFVYALYGGSLKNLPQRISGSVSISLALSLLSLGLLLGLFIDGNNLMVPAHYHAVTGAINLTFMGLGYELLPSLGFLKPDLQWLKRQQQLYASGVALLALGLAWSGSLGGARKMLGQSDGTMEQLFAWLTMGLGGLLSLLGCFLFLGLVFLNMRKKQVFSSFSTLSKTALIKGSHDV